MPIEKAYNQVQQGWDRMRSPCMLLAALLAAALAACGPREKSEQVDFTDRAPVRTATADSVSPPQVLRIAVASIFSGQESFSHYESLTRYLSEKCAVPVSVHYCKKYRDAYELFKTDEVDLGILCVGLYVVGKRKGLLDLLAMTVLNGNPGFQAYVIVPSTSPAKTYGDLSGKTFAFSDELSLTGYFYPLHRSGGEAGTWAKTLFSGSHDFSIDLVNRGVVDGASVSSFVYQSLERNRPASVANVRILDRSENFGSPPVVVSVRVPGPLRSRIRGILLAMDSDSAGAAALRSVGIDGFIPGSDSLYASARATVPPTVDP